MKTHDILVRVGDGRFGYPMIETEIISAGSAKHLDGIIEDAWDEMALHNITTCTVYRWLAGEYVVDRWLDMR